jgi:hypothetical protein
MSRFGITSRWGPGEWRRSQVDNPVEAVLEEQSSSLFSIVYRVIFVLPQVVVRCIALPSPWAHGGLA